MDSSAAPSPTACGDCWRCGPDLPDPVVRGPDPAHRPRRPQSAGGKTSAANGQGLCEACNYTKQAPAGGPDLDRPEPATGSRSHPDRSPLHQPTATAARCAATGRRRQPDRGTRPAPDPRRLKQSGPAYVCTGSSPRHRDPTTGLSPTLWRMDPPAGSSSSRTSRRSTTPWRPGCGPRGSTSTRPTTGPPRSRGAPRTRARPRRARRDAARASTGSRCAAGSRRERPVPVLMLTARDDEADVLVGLGRRRRRLPDQAVPHARAGRPGARAAAPGRARRRAGRDGRPRRAWSATWSIDPAARRVRRRRARRCT